jgi:[Skp1-protein]-hydroxyproline N-acetylglucosaminyltransferase
MAACASAPLAEAIAAASDATAAPRIFVSVIAYRDPELVPTLRSLFGQASQPERLVAGVVWQGNNEDACDVATLRALDEFVAQQRAGAVRQLRLVHTEARGPCFARALAQQELMQDEEFYLQLDSHMRFARGWDEELLRQWQLCDDPRAVLSTYPPPYEREESPSTASSAAVASSFSVKSGSVASSAATSAPGVDMFAAPVSALPPPTILCATSFHPSDGMLRISGRLLRSCPPRPLASAFYAAGFAFGPRAMVTSAPYDPLLQNAFFGEESSMLARLWTAGFNFYAPMCSLVWHCWSRAYRPTFRELLGQPPGAHSQGQEDDSAIITLRHKRREQVARTRIRHVLGMTQTKEDAAALDELGLTNGSDAAAATATAADAFAFSVGAGVAPNAVSFPSSSSAAATAAASADPLVPVAPYGLGSVRTLSDFYAHCGVDFATRTVSARGRRGGLDDEALFVQPLQAAQQAQDKLDAVMQILKMQQASKRQAAAQ